MSQDMKGKFAWAVEIDGEGRIPLPQEAQTAFGLGPGAQAMLLGNVDKGLAIAPAPTS